MELKTRLKTAWFKPCVPRILAKKVSVSVKMGIIYLTNALVAEKLDGAENLTENSVVPALCPKNSG